jgi:hypothetical protein
MLPIETTTLRPRLWPFFLIIAAGILLFFFSSQKNNSQHLIWFEIGFIVFVLVLWFLLSRANIVVDDSGLVHKNIFTTKEIAWDGVVKSYIKYRHYGKSGSYYWHFENSNGEKARFSIKLYSRSSLRVIAEAVIMKCKNADIEQRILNMAEGQFPWYIW